jgi:hypothetical protein
LNGYLYLGEALGNSGDREAEEALYKEALAEFPDNASLLRRIGRLCDKAGRLEEAAEHYKTLLVRGREQTSAVQIRGNNVDIALRLGQIYDRLGDTQRAERLYRSYLRSFPNTAAVQKALQASYLKSSTMVTSPARVVPAKAGDKPAASSHYHSSTARAIVICVDFADLLQITLPRNAAHFTNVLVVSSPDDEATAAVVKSVPNATLFTTDAFYKDGAAFNKGLAMEVGLDHLGRQGWIAILDSDILLPRSADFSSLPQGYLFSAHRRILADTTAYRESLDWGKLPLAPDRELAGYLQVFHAADPVLKKLPWYGTDWIHAGGCDSEFQRRWPISRKFRFAWEVLHLGLPGENWCGRVTQHTDASRPAEAETRTARLKEIINTRKATGSFSHEKQPS